MSKLAEKATKICLPREIVLRCDLEPDPDQDRIDLIVIANSYMNIRRCASGRLIQSGYVCPHCYSDDPSNVCFSKKVAKLERDIQELVVETDRKNWRIVKV